MAFLEMYLNGEWKNLSSFGTVSSVDIQSSSSAISVTGSPITSVGIINLSFNPSSIRLDQFAVPTSNLDINNKRIINVSDPVNPQDVATKAFVQASIPTISVDGAVIGTINNQGLINTTLNSLQTISNALNNFTWIYNYQPNAAGLITTNQIIVNDNSIANARFINRISRKSNTNNSFEYTHWIDDALTGSSSQIMQMGFVNGNTGVVSPGEIFVFFSAVKHNDNTCFVDFNVNIKIPNGTSSNHAINKGQLDSKTWTSSSITDFSTASTTAAKTISLDQFAIPAANLNLNNKNITNLATPTLSNHAADKYYVDSRRISDFNSPITDISMNTNKIINLASPTLSGDAVNKNYVDTRSVNELAAPISAFSMNNNRITNVSNPTASQDVATKNYVDTISGGINWISYTPTITCPTTNPTLPSASNVFYNCQYTVVGKTMFIRFHLGLNATGAKGSGLYLFSIPSGYTIDSSIYFYDQDIITRNASSNGGLSTDGYWSNFWQSQVGTGIVSQGSGYTTDVKVSPVYAQGNNKLCLFSAFMTTTAVGLLMRNCYINSDYFMFTGDMPAIYKFNATIKIV